QELVVVEGEELTDGGVLGPCRIGGRQRIRVLSFDPAAGDVDGDDAGELPLGAGTAVLNQRTLQGHGQRPAIRSNGESFGSLVGDTSEQAPVVDIYRVVAGAAGLGGGGGVGDHGEAVGQPERADALARGAHELVDIRTVFVGNEHELTVIR